MNCGETSNFLSAFRAPLLARGCFRVFVMRPPMRMRSAAVVTHVP